MLDLVNNAEYEAIDSIYDARPKRTASHRGTTLRCRARGAGGLGERPPGIRQRQHQDQRIVGGGEEVVASVKTGGGFIQGVDEEGADAGDFGGFQGSYDGVLEHAFRHPLALPAAIHGKAGDDHDGDRVGHVAPYPAGRRSMVDRARGETIERNDPIALANHIGSRGAGGLVFDGSFLQPVIEQGLAAIEPRQIVVCR